MRRSAVWSGGSTCSPLSRRETGSGASIADIMPRVRPHPLKPALGAAVLLTLLSRAGAAQFGYFGRTRTRYRGFAWPGLRGNQVDWYYYRREQGPGRSALASPEG